MESYYRVIIAFFSVYLNTFLALFKVIDWFSGTVFILVFFLFD